jgi:hypothetical protein
MINWLNYVEIIIILLLGIVFPGALRRTGTTAFTASGGVVLRVIASGLQNNLVVCGPEAVVVSGMAGTDIKIQQQPVLRASGVWRIMPPYVRPRALVG